MPHFSSVEWYRDLALPDHIVTLTGLCADLRQTVMGAGGGGFLLVLTKAPDQETAVLARLDALELREENLSVHRVAVDREGLQVTVGDQKLPLKQHFTNYAR